jgi:hypothetical protein
MRDKAPFLRWKAFHQLDAMICFQHLLENLKQQKNECQTVNVLQDGHGLKMGGMPTYCRRMACNTGILAEYGVGVTIAAGLVT